jgi:multimeric flavodoxin WrbA
MTIVTIMGSPRKNGNTATVLKAFEALACAKATIHRVDAAIMKIAGCRGCDACQRNLDRPGCVQKDDMVAILETIMAADMVVYAAPVYVWDFPAQMKSIVDRHYCLVKNTTDGQARHLIENKPTVLLTTCGGTAEDNADLLRSIFEREMDYLRCRVVGEYVLPLCTLPSELGARGEQMARQMFTELFT